MKVLSLILLGACALGIVTFKCVTSLPRVKTTPAPFNWQQYLPPDDTASAEKRAAAGGDASTAENGGVPPNAALNPLSPFLTIKPFLPVKPTFVPPFVDPNLFIGKKAELLGNLFGTGTGVNPAPADSKRALSEEESTVSAQPRLVVGGPSLWGPPAGLFPKPSIAPPGYWSPFPAGAPAAGPVPPVVDPSVMIDKKTKFLTDLFSSLNTAPGAPGVSARAVLPDSAPAEPTPKPTIVPPSYWLQFIPAFAAPPAPTTPKPTIVPPSFWIPSAVTKPVGLFGPPVPVVDPNEILAKKTTFLNTLFSTLNISVTPAPITTPEPTLDPVAAYQEKVADFLDKLFNALINNGTDKTTQAKRALEAAEKAKTAEDLKTFLGQVDDVEETAAHLESELDTRSAFERRSAGATADTTSQLPVDALLTAKDKVVNTIITEMGGIKNNILETLTELLAKQKEAAATPAPTPGVKKPGPPFGPGGPFGIGGPFGMGGPLGGPFAKFAAPTTPKPTPDPEPFQKKVEFLSQVFDTLTQLEKDVTEALNQAVSEAASAGATTATPEHQATEPSAPTKQNGTSLIDLIRNKLAEIANSTAPNQQVVQEVPKYARAIIPFPGKPIGPPTPAPTIVDPSFWIPDPAAGIAVGPEYYLGKTQTFLNKLFASKAAAPAVSDDDDTATNKARSIKMAVHQGYQSLPPGSEELLQAGGGSTPQEHEGGGLKLQGSASTAFPSLSQGRSNSHRHHNHHNRD